MGVGPGSGRGRSRRRDRAGCWRTPTPGLIRSAIAATTCGIERLPEPVAGRRQPELCGQQWTREINGRVDDQVDRTRAGELTQRGKLGGGVDTPEHGRRERDPVACRCRLDARVLGRCPDAVPSREPGLCHTRSRSPQRPDWRLHPVATMTSCPRSASARPSGMNGPNTPSIGVVLHRDSHQTP